MNFGLGYKDWTRIAWTFVQAVLGYAALAAADYIPGSPFNWKAFAIGAAAAGVSAVKNFVLADESPIK